MEQTFESAIAKKYGIEEAILIDFIHKQITTKGKYAVRVNGKRGIRIKLADLVEFVPCLNYRIAQFTLYRLRDIGAIILERSKEDDGRIVCYLLSKKLEIDIKSCYKED